MNVGHCGTSVSKLFDGVEMLLSFSKVKIDVANIIGCQHHLTGKQRVATAVFSQHHQERWYCIALFCFNYHLQYFVLCV